MNFLRKLFSLVGPYQINVTFDLSADSVFVTNKKEIKSCFVSKRIKPEWRGYGVTGAHSPVQYDVATIKMAPSFVRNNGSQTVVV